MIKIHVPIQVLLNTVRTGIDEWLPYTGTWLLRCTVQFSYIGTGLKCTGLRHRDRNRLTVILHRERIERTNIGMGEGFSCIVEKGID